MATQASASVMTDLVNNFVPATPVPAKDTGTKWTLAMIDAMAGRRNNFIVVMVDNPKKPDSIASRNWHLYGTKGKPTVTVAEFLRGGDNPYYPARDNGVTRARASLLWDLQRNFVRIEEIG